MTLAPLVLAALLATDPPAAGASAAKPACAAAEHRVFDFWVGRWEVTANGKRAGENVIESILDGCALRESWTGARGNKGTSLSWWEAADGRWHQLWLDDDGLVLRLEGGARGRDLVLEGELPGKEGRPVRQRITWSPLAGGGVRQHWEASPDGKRWETVFDGIYAPRRG